MKSAASSDRSLTVLISSAGRRGELLQCFRRSAEDIGVDLRLLACDLDPEWSAACHLADRAFAVPRADDPTYVDSLLEICAREGVDLLVPAIDTELIALSQAHSQFAEQGTWVSVSEPGFVQMARDKEVTARALAEHGIPTPATYTLEEVAGAPDGFEWPMMAKPNHGSAGRLISIIERPQDLPVDPPEPLILQELLVGPEYTINMFFDRQGRAATVIPHRRVGIRAGEVEKGVTERRADICRIGWKLAEAFTGVRGVICFQAIVTDRGPYVFEINARFGGGYPLAHAAGGEFARWLMQEALGWPCEANDDWQEGVRMMRYDAAVFLPS